MYLDHWSLERAPFDARPDSRFLLATAQHELALAAISYAACEAGEPVLLRGEAGCGKTLLLRTLRRQLPREQYDVAFVPEVACSQVGLLERVAYHLARATGNTAPPAAADASAAMNSILQQAQDAEAGGRSTILMLDNWPAQAEASTLEELRWLLSLDLENCHLCTLMAGEGVCPDGQWPTWLVQRLLTSVQLGPLTAEQVPEYIAHRLRIASGTAGNGQDRGELFSPEASALIAEWSRGVPRLVNRVAHLALHVAYLDLAKRVEPDAVRRAIDRLALPDGAQSNTLAGAQSSAEITGTT